MLVLQTVVFCILFMNQIQSARILAYFPTPSISHQVVFRPVIHALASRGHDVTVITTDPAFPKGGTPPNLTEIDVHDISYNLWKKVILETSKNNQEDDGVAQASALLGTAHKVFDAQMRDEKVLTLINDKTKKYDLLISEAYLRPLLVFSHIYKVPVIQFSSLGPTHDNIEVVNGLMQPLLYPHPLRRRLHNLTLWEKVIELYSDYKLHKLWKDYQVTENNLLRKHFGPGVPSVHELNNNVDMLFLNVHPMFDGVRPVSPAIVYLGGLHQKPSKELPADLKSYLDSSKNGVVYISFGTNVEPSLLPPEKLQTLVRVVSQLPYDVLWKWNTDELPGRTENIRISKWLPQSDLLKHPKIKLFITQGGLQSTDEAITAGVPMLGMPMLGDQWHNTEKYELHGIGIKVEMKTLTEEKFRNAINTIIADDSYRRNVERLRALMRDEPQSPLDRAIWWTEHVLRHKGAKHLRSPSANISLAQYLELELLFTVAAVLFVALLVIVLALRLVYRYIRSYFSNVKIKRA